MKDIDVDTIISSVAQDLGLKVVVLWDANGEFNGIDLKDGATDADYHELFARLSQELPEDFLVPE